MGEVVEHEIPYPGKISSSVGGQKTSFMPCKVFHLFRCFYFLKRFFGAHTMGEVVEHEMFHIRKLFFGSVCGQEISCMSCNVFLVFV